MPFLGTVAVALLADTGVSGMDFNDDENLISESLVGRVSSNSIALADEARCIIPRRSGVFDLDGSTFSAAMFLTLSWGADDVLS
jgi:hypothetical protein